MSYTYKKGSHDDGSEMCKGKESQCQAEVALPKADQAAVLCL